VHQSLARDSLLLALYLNCSRSTPDWQQLDIESLQLTSSEELPSLCITPLTSWQTENHRQVKLFEGRIPEGSYQSLLINWREGIEGQSGERPSWSRNFSTEIDIDYRQFKGGCLLLNFNWEPIAGGGKSVGSGIYLQEFPSPPLGALVFISCEQSDCITVVDRFSGRVTDLIEVGNRPQGLAWSRSAQQLFVACAGSNQIAVADGQGHSLIKHFQLQFGDTPSRLALSPDESQLYVLNSGSGTLVVLDIDSGQEAARVVIGEDPGALSVDPLAGYVYVTEKSARRIVTYDPVTEGVFSSTLTLGEPGEILYDQFSGLCFVTHGRQPALSGLDPRSGILKVTIDLCSPGEGLAYQRVGGLLYIAEAACSEVVSYRPEYEIEMGRIHLDGTPGRLSITPDSGQLLVCLPDDDQLAIYETGDRNLKYLIETGRRPHTALVPR
jgi:YVTN family beta-propeller protein